MSVLNYITAKFFQYLWRKISPYSPKWFNFKLESKYGMLIIILLAGILVFMIVILR